MTFSRRRNTNLHTNLSFLSVIAFLAFLLLVGATDEVFAGTIVVPAGGDLQAAIDIAQPGDTIILQAGGSYNGNFRLRNKGITSAAGTITIRTSNLAGIPGAGERVSHTHDGAMARILAPGNGLPAIETDAGAGFYKLIGIYVSVNYTMGHGSSFLITLGNGNDSNPNYGVWLSHDITFDRCHVAGKFGDSRFAFAVHGERLTVINSIVDEFANPPGNDSAGFWFPNGGGHLLENNLISAGMWMIDFGGADSDSPNRARVTTATTTSANLTSFEGTRPVVGDLLAFKVWDLPGGTFQPSIPQWQPNTNYVVGSTLWAGQDFLGRTRFFYVSRSGTTGATPPNWNSTTEYHGEDLLEDGTLQWTYFNGHFMVGKVIAVNGDSVSYVRRGPDRDCPPSNGREPGQVERLQPVSNSSPQPLSASCCVG